MSTSKFCIRQRQKEQEHFTKLLLFSFAGSTLLHGILAYALPRWSFKPPTKVENPMEVILVDKPKPKTQQKVEPKPEPKVESKPVIEPKPEPKVESKPVVEPKPEPLKAQTPPPKPKLKPVPQPKPAPNKILTAPTPVPLQPLLPTPIKNTALAPSSSDKPAENIIRKETVPEPVATNIAPPLPEASNENKVEISCVSNCKPDYPAALEGAEGSAGIKLTIDSNGKVISAELASADSNSLVNRQALLAARKMQFSSSGSDAASVRVKIDFTVEGSEYDRARREEKEKREQAAREREQQKAAHQQQLEAERQARQEQLQIERQTRQQQLEQEQKLESVPPPVTDTQPAPKLLPARSESELDKQRLRKFRERIENYHQE